MILDATTKKLEIILAGAITTNQLPFSCSWVDITTSSFTPGANDGQTNGATAVDLVAAPAASTQRQVKYINIYNADTVAATVTVRYNNNATLRTLFKAVLLTLEHLIWDGQFWKVLDATGALKTVAATTNPFEGLTGVLRADAGVLGTDSDVTDIVSAASDVLAGKIELAIQSEMEAATDNVRAVTPVQMKFHPGVCKGWGKAAGSGSLTTGYNMDAVTDTGTGRLGVNITTDISSANYAILTSLASVATTLTVATVDNGGLVYNASQAAGAFGIWDYDDTATTHVAQDPQSYFWAIFGDFA